MSSKTRIAKKERDDADSMQNSLLWHKNPSQNHLKLSFFFFSELLFQCYHAFILWLWKDALFHYRIQSPPLLRWKEGIHHTSQMNILSVRENALSASLNFDEDRAWIKHKFSKTPNRSGRREKNKSLGINQERFAFSA